MFKVKHNFLSTTCFTAAFICMPFAALANPENGVVAAGQATITETAKKLDIHQQSHKAVIDWRSFDIAPDEHTEFHQPSSSSITLNRVNSQNASSINGKLTANGHVVIVNQNGVLFGRDAQVDVSGLVASTADIDNSHFMSNTTIAFDKKGNANAAIINEGTITIKEAGLAGFVAPEVVNNGVILANLGRVHLASGDTATVDMYGDGLMHVAVSDAVASQIVSNTGVIAANGGKIALTAAAGADIVNSLIVAEGTLRAQTISQKNGEIIIGASGSNSVTGNVTADKGKKQGNSRVNLKGTLDVSGRNEAEYGGKVTVTGDHLVVFDGSRIDAAGHSGGGEIYIGGDYQGLNTTPTARWTQVERNTLMDVSALQTGDAGKAIIWADHNTFFNGTILAKGGEVSGDGGFVEVSGKEYLRYKGYVNTLATNGMTGLLLLDPTDIVILNGTGDGNDADASNASTNVTVAAGDLGPTQIYQSELEGIASGTAISLTSTNSITINDLSTNILNLDQNVTFSTGTGGFTMNTGDAINSTGSISIITTGGTSTIGSLGGNGTKILNTGGTANVSGVISGTGGLTKSGTGTLRLSGNNTFSGTTTINAGTIAAASDTALGTSTVSLFAATLSATGGPRILMNTINLLGNGFIAGTEALTLNGAFTNSGTNRTLSVSNTALTTLGGTINLSENATGRTLILAGAGNVTMSGVIQNRAIAGAAGSLTQGGTGTLTLSGNNTFTGTTTINSGTLAVGSDTALGTSALSLNGGTLRAAGGPRALSNTITLVNNAAIGGSEALTLSGALTNSGGNRILTSTNTALTTFGGAVNLSNDGTGRSLILAGTGNITMSGVVQNRAIAGAAGHLTQNGTGTLTLSGNNTFSGSTTISAGTVVTGSDTALGTSTVSLSGGTISASGGPRILANTINLFGNGFIAGTEAMTLNGVLTNSGNNRTLTVSNTALTTLGGTVNLSENGTGRTLILAGAGNVTMSGVIQNRAIAGTAGNLTHSGTGTLTLSGNNLYTGTTTISSGTLAAGSDTALGTSALSLNGGTLSAVGGPRALSNTITLSNNSIIGGSEALTLSGALTNSGGNRTLTSTNTALTTLSGNVNLSESGTGRTLTVAGTGNITMSGVIQNRAVAGAAGSIIKSDAGTLTLSGNNIYTGTTTLNGGTLRLASANRIADVSAVTIGAGGIFDLNGFSETVASIINNGSITMGTGNTLTTTNAQTHNGTISGGTVTLASTTASAITATNALNNFTGNLSISTTGAASIVDANNLSLGTVSASTFTAEALNGDITLNGQINASATAATRSITLHAGNRFINLAGATALQNAGSAYSLVFSADSALDNRNGLTGYNRYGCSYNAGAANCAAGTNIPASGDGFYAVNAPTLTITGLTAANKIYNTNTAATVTGTAALSGLLNGDTLTTLNSSGASFAFDNKNVGTGKTVTASGFVLSGTNQGYLISQPSLTANITPADVSILSMTAQNKIYDGTLTATVNAGSVTFNGQLGSDDISINGGVLSASFADKNVGINKAVNITNIALTGADANNYALTSNVFSGATANITQRALSISADALTKTYGAADPAFTYNYGALAAGDTDSIFSGSLSRANGQNVGNYMINLGTLSAGSNYSINFTDSNLTINPALLTITANNASRIQGISNPVFTATYSGFQYSDNSSVLSGLNISSPANSSSAAGTYVITPSGASAANYTMSYIDGLLTVTSAAKTVIIPSSVSNISQLAVQNAGSDFAFSFSPFSNTLARTGPSLVFRTLGADAEIVSSNNSNSAQINAVIQNINYPSANRFAQNFSLLSLNNALKEKLDSYGINNINAQ